MRLLINFVLRKSCSTLDSVECKNMYLKIVDPLLTHGFDAIYLTYQWCMWSKEHNYHVYFVHTIAVAYSDGVEGTFIPCPPHPKKKKKRSDFAMF